MVPGNIQACPSSTVRRGKCSASPCRPDTRSVRSEVTRMGPVGGLLPGSASGHHDRLASETPVMYSLGDLASTRGDTLEV
jgi:hypothetical protein